MGEQQPASLIRCRSAGVGLIHRDFHVFQTFPA